MDRLIAKIIFLALLLPLPPIASAQTNSAAEKSNANADERPLYFPEIEVLASPQFRSALIIVPVWKSLALDSRYYGNDEANIGLSGAAWEFTLWKRRIMLAPGLSMSYGQDLRTAPLATMRWDIKQSWFHAEGYSALSIIASQKPDEREHPDEPYSTHAYLSDGNHISANWKRLEGGFAWEHIAVREEQEWKAGGRFSIALTKHFNFVAFILTPEPEFRCGLSFHPAEKE